MYDVLRPAPLENVHLTGPVGSEIERVIGARMLSATARQEIVPEAVAAFRTRVDDRLRPGQGLWQGEFWGKWVLSAVAAWRYTGNADLLDLIRQSTHDIIATQRKDGYIGTYHDSGFVVGNTWNVWCRKYTLWGLLDAYEVLGEDRVLEAAAGLMDHLMTEVGPDWVDIVRTGNFYGLPSSSILTPVLKLHRLTRELRILEYAYYIVEQWEKFPGQPPDIVRRGLTGKPVHQWFPEAGAWTKAYEFISCVEGLLDLHRVSGEPDYLEAARKIHRAIRDHERVITGGIGNNDKLLNAASRPDGLNEPCDVVYWERLNLELLRLTGAPEYADEIERLAWNVLMAAMNRDGSWGVRRLGLSEPHLIGVLHCQLEHHHCCVANIPRGLLQLAQAAIMSAAEEDAIAVNLVLPGTATVSLASGPAVALDTATGYPEDGKVRIQVSPEQPAEFALRLRIPPWSTHTRIRVNGKSVPADSARPGEYTELRRTWQAGDSVEMELDMHGRSLTLPGPGGYAAIARGPVVLARSAKLTPDDVHAPVTPAADASGRVELTPAEPPDGVRSVFDVPTVDGDSVQLCDYASTGKDFVKPSPQMPRKQMIDNRTVHPLRVWLRVSGSGKSGAE